MAFIRGETKKIPLRFSDFRLLSYSDNGSINSQSMTRAADNSKNRIGKLDLYEEPEDVVKHYEEAGFDIVEEMKNRKGNCLWIKARAIDGDVANENGDYFSWEEIKKEREIQSDRNKKKIASYKSFEGVPIYTNHENTDIQKAKGKVVFAELDEDEKCVYCTFYIDVDAYPDIARAIQLGTITDVSMGCFPAGTLVLTEEGYKPIETVNITDKLLDVNGNLTKIKNKQVREYNGKLIGFEIEGGNTVKATEEHPFLVIKGSKNNEAEYIYANNIEIDDFLLFPRNIEQYARFENREIKRHNDDYILRKVKNIFTEEYKDNVFNFETESNSYIVENCIVHNCQVEWSTCSICENKAEKESEWCVPGDTLISMSNGKNKKIKEVNVGDIVITHLGNNKRVLKVFERNINEDIIKIKNNNDVLLITRNHPIYVSKNGRDFDFVESGRLNESYYLYNNNEKINKIQNIHYSGKVYNLEVEDDNSYIANGIAVHNCEHLKTRKGKKFSGVIDKGNRKGKRVQDELVYEDNHDLKFIELSIVSDGAFENCKMTDILPHQEVLDIVDNVKTSATNIKRVVAKNMDNLMKKRATPYSMELVDSLDSSNNILDKIEKFSSFIMDNIMQKKASMNKESYMNVLDTLNDVLNKIEAVIISLLGRKDNIDLTHVAKISKSMSELQQVVSDLIDDGIGTLSSAVNLQQPEVPQQAGQQAAPADYSQPGNVGRAMGMETGNMQTQPVANILEEPMMSTVPYQFTPNLEPSGFEQAAYTNNKWNKFSNNLKQASDKLEFIINDLNPQEIYKNPEQGGISEMSKQLNERVANALANKIATVVEQPIIASRNNGKFKIVISDKDGEEVVGYYDNKKVDWQPSSLTVEDIDSIRENRIASVSQKIMDEFVGYVKTASWDPITPVDVKEQQLGDKRTGNPEDVQEQQLSNKRVGNPEDVQEQQIGVKREGAPEDKSEARLQNDSATEWGRKGNPANVQEQQLGDVRKDYDDNVWEHKLETRRSKTSEVKVANDSITALSHTVCDSGASPSEVLDVAKAAIDDEKFVSKVASYFNSNSYNTRIAKRERVDLGLDEPSVKNINNAFLERIADVLVEDEGIAVDDIKIALNSIVSAPKDGMKKLIGKVARENAQNIRLSSNNDKTRDDLIKGAVYAAISDTYEEPMDRSHLKVALFAVAETADEAKVTPEEIFEVIEDFDDQNALVTLETERLPNSIASRIRNKERSKFWGKVASSDSKDIAKTLFGSLADYAEAMEVSEKKELPSHLIWKVAKKLSNGGQNAKILVNAAIQARVENNNEVKTAASLTDKTDTIREIRFCLDEIPEVDPSSDDFAETVRDYVIALLNNKGYRVDPETFNFTNLCVDEDAGEVTAVIQSSIVKRFSDEKFSVEKPEELNELDVEKARNIPVDFSESGLAGEPIFSAMALNNRKNKREALVRESQAAPMQGMGLGAAPQGQAQEAVPPGGDLTEGADAGPGLSSLLGGAEGEVGEEDDTNLDNISSPGQIKPLGSICPACGSTNVDLASGKGECSDCHTKFDIKVSLENVVTPDESEGLPNQEEEPEETPEGLGAALAPAGAEGFGGGAGGEMPGGATPPPAIGGGMPMAASVSWYATPEQFVKLARKRAEGLTDEQIEGPKPPGTVCVACGNKQVRRAKSKCFCDKCGSISKIDIKESSKHDDKLICTVSYLLPPLQ